MTISHSSQAHWRQNPWTQICQFLCSLGQAISWFSHLQNENKNGPKKKKNHLKWTRGNLIDYVCEGGPEKPRRINWTIQMLALAGSIYKCWSRGRSVTEVQGWGHLEEAAIMVDLERHGGDPLAGGDSPWGIQRGEKYPVFLTLYSYSQTQPERRQLTGEPASAPLWYREE